MEHQLREGIRFFGTHSPKKRGHQKSGDLIIGNNTFHVAVDDILQFVWRESCAVALFADEFVDCQDLEYCKKLRKAVDNPVRMKGMHLFP